MDNQNNEDYSDFFKVVLVGDAGVGKTHLMTRYVKGCLPKMLYRPLGLSLLERQSLYKMAKRLRHKFGIPLDRKGTEESQALIFEKQEELWLFMMQQRRRLLKVLLSGWRICDIRPNQMWLQCQSVIKQTQLKTMEAQEKFKRRRKNLAQQHKVLFEESSAVTGQNVGQCFDRLLQEMYKIKSLTPGQDNQNQGISLINQNQTQNPDNCKC